MGETVMYSANHSLMCEADAAAAHEAAAETWASEPAADSMPAEAATGVTTTEAATVTTAATAAARFGNAARGSDDNCRNECSFDCKCRDIHVCTRDSRKPRSINSGLCGSFRDALKRCGQ
jgi:hypothetical protein